MEIKMKTSEQWQEEYKTQFKVLDPDGWDRKNFKYSWYEELITKCEFLKRVEQSTCQFNKMEAI